ncbi:MAG: (2Fe-2S) ferredoxin domain-containing protein [Phormidesmis sp.]
MDVLQGRYLKPITSKSGKLKGLQIEVGDGIESIYLPKPLRIIAQQELDTGDELRIWSTRDQKSSQKKSQQSKSQKRWAVQVIPLSPRAQVATQPTAITLEKQFAQKLEKASGQKLGQKLDQKPDRETKKQKKKKTKRVTVQLCQKKNCCKRGGTQLWESFEQAAEDAAQTPFKLEAVGCLGGCKRGPNIRFLPDNVKHYHVQSNDVLPLLSRHQG